MSEMSLSTLRVSEDSVLAHALSRLVDDLHDPDNVISGFQSAL